MSAIIKIDADLEFVLCADDARRTGNLEPLYNCATMRATKQALIAQGYMPEHAKKCIEDVCRKFVANSPVMPDGVRAVIMHTIRQNN